MARYRQELDEHRKIALKFLSSEEGLQRTFIMRTVLESQVCGMRKLLKGNEVQWEIDELLKSSVGNQRDYHVTDMWKASSRGGLFKNMLVSTMERVSAPEWWAACTPIERLATEIFRTAMRMAASAYYLLMSRCRGFPAQLFAILADEEEVDNVLKTYRETPCMLDPWSREYVEKRPSSEALLDPESMWILSTLAESLMTNSGPTPSTLSVSTPSTTSGPGAA